MSKAQGSVTLVDVISRRWGDPGRWLRAVGVAIVVISMMGYVGAQMTAVGKAFSTTLGLEGSLNLGGIQLSGYLLGVLIGAGVITVITSIGGFRGVAWTDLFQGLLMAAALLAFPLYAVLQIGGFGPLFEGLGAINPDFLTATQGRVESFALGFVIGDLAIGLGYPGMPHVITRYMAARDSGQVRRMQLIGMVWGVIVLYGAGLLGLAGRVILPDLADGERTMMELALTLLHPVLAGLMLAAVLSAILSTVSSQLLVAASAISYDVVEGVMGRHPDDRRSLVLGRWTVVIVGLLGILLALTEVRAVFWFVLFAWSALGASFGPLILFAVTKVHMNRHGALAGMLTGFGVTVIWKLGRDAAVNPDAFQWSIWGTLLIALLLIVAGSISGRMGRGERLAVIVAALMGLAAWLLVPRGVLTQLYELVPAFFMAAAAALIVARLAPVRKTDPTTA
jgi:SSS family transporter